jgi:hypothetical protein
MTYSSGIRIEEDEEKECEQPATKKAKTDNNKKHIRKKEDSKKEVWCKCGGCDHMRITLPKCP